MIGLQFKVKNEYNNFLLKILASVNVEQYDWDIITDDIIDANNPKDNDGIFNAATIDGQHFLHSILKESYYLIFVDLKSFPVGSKHAQIRVFEDFVNSECQIILLCVDSIFIELYCKDQQILETIYKNCLKYGFEDVEFISFENASNRNMIAF